METDKKIAKILVVDDEEAIRSLVQAILERDGHTIVTACNGVEAVSKAEECQPDLVIMDITMPKMDGYEATQRIKETPELANTPVIFLTGRSADEDGGRSFAYGALTFVRKPFTSQQLSDLIQLTLQSLAG